MNNLFAAKLLQNLRNKKGNKGFTLIELLVVVIIIGVLAAVALPNLLGQVGKARESEAKSTIGALNRAQQAYFTEKAAFATSTNLLEIPVGNEKYYTITVPAAGIQLAVNPNNAADGTQDYLGGVSYNTTNRSFATVVCRGVGGTALTGAATEVTNTGSGAGNVAACGVDSATATLETIE